MEWCGLTVCGRGTMMILMLFRLSHETGRLNVKVHHELSFSPMVFRVDYAIEKEFAMRAKNAIIMLSHVASKN